MGMQTAIFRKIVRDYLSGSVVTVDRDSPVSAVVGKMSTEGASSAVVTAADGSPVGILTEQDVVRKATFQVAPETPVSQVMTAPVFTIRDDDLLYRAVAYMRRRGLRHMPVIDGAGRVAGLLELHAAMATASGRMMDLIDQLTHDETLAGLQQVKAAQVEVAETLVEENLETPEIQQLLTEANLDLYRTVVRLSLRGMAKDGWGEAPVAFAVLVMGSGGRGENYLYPDQDNGFVLADYPDSEHNRIDGYFTELADRMTRALDEIGIPLCKGNVMATNPVWRKTLSQWQAQIRSWLKRRDHVALRLSDIFFDFRGVFGDDALATTLRRHVTDLTKGNKAFLREMYRDDEDHGVALGLFDRFITERDIPEHRGKINLKQTGTLPLVEVLRLLALQQGIEIGSTLGRIEALREAGVLDADEQDYLRGAFGHVTFLLLRQELADYRSGAPLSKYIAPKSLSRRERDMLVDSFKAIRGLRKRVRAEFTGDIF